MDKNKSQSKIYLSFDQSSSTEERRKRIIISKKQFSRVFVDCWKCNLTMETWNTFGICDLCYVTIQQAIIHNSKKELTTSQVKQKIKEFLDRERNINLDNWIKKKKIIKKGLQL